MSRDVGAHPVPHPEVARLDNHHQPVDNQRLVTPDGGDMRVVTREQHKRWINDRTAPRDADIRLNNQVLLSELQEWEERTHRQHMRHQETAGLQQADFREWHAKGGSLLEKQQEGTRWEKMPELSVDNLIDQLGLQVKWEELQALRGRYNDSHSCDFFYTNALRNLLQGKSTRQHIHAEELSKVQDENQNADFIRTAREVFELSLSKPMDVDAILKVLQQSDAIIKQLKRKLEQTNAQRIQALHEREDMAAAEQLHNEMDDVLEDLVNVHLERLDLLLSSGQGEAFLARLDEAVDFLRKLLEDGRADADNLAQRLNQDLDAADRELKERHRQREDDALEMQRKQTKCKQLLQENSQKQNQAFDEITRLYRELTALGDERKGYIDDLVHEKTEHEKRAAAFERFCVTAAEHRGILEDLLRRLELTQETYDGTEKFVQLTKDNMAKTTELARQETADILLKEQRDYYSAFREYYKTLGELLYAKERRLEETEDHMDCLSQKIKLAHVCLDRHAQSYKEQLRDLQRSRQLNECEIDDLRERADRAVEEAQATEEALVAAGDPIVSPAIELQEENVRRQAAVTEARKESAKKRVDDVERQEQDSHRAQRDAKQARASGLSLHMRPLSPDPSKYKHKPLSQMTPEERRQQMDARKRSLVYRLRQTMSEGDDSPGAVNSLSGIGVGVNQTASTASPGVGGRGPLGNSLGNG
eukprot:TRINITY_DN3014_c4_g1_i1.p1 TRINITY_DN3014_c4_g1~~TRINITY_DN3014_c4_g1_i1.p1  ORF type:complete len:705 (+),score=325.23 TRINITY_DN3014_c4_g1_i1:60-2174(+)